MPLKQISPFFSYWRVTTALDREVVDAVIAPDYSRDTPELQEALRAWPGTYYWSPAEGPNRVVLIRALTPSPRERWGIHLALFLATFATVWGAGAILMVPTLRFGLADSPNLAVLWQAIKDWIGASTPGLGFATELTRVSLRCAETGRPSHRYSSSE